MTESDKGFFGKFGGRYVAEVLRRPIEELEEAFHKCMKDPDFLKELEEIRTANIFWIQSAAKPQRTCFF